MSPIKLRLLSYWIPLIIKCRGLWNIFPYKRSAIWWHYYYSELQISYSKIYPFSTGLFQSLHPGLQSLDLPLTQQQPTDILADGKGKKGQKGKNPHEYFPAHASPHALPQSVWPSLMCFPWFMLALSYAFPDPRSNSYTFPCILSESHQPPGCLLRPA